MARSEILYLLPYQGLPALSLGVFYYDWQRRQAKGVNAYVWYVVGQTLWVFGFIVELLSLEMAGHSHRVTETNVTVARALDFSEDDVEHIRRGAILHDIGIMGIPGEILRKKGALTEEERQKVIKHPDTAFDLFKQIPFLKGAMDIPYCHHEKWDGSGYPRGLKRFEIPLSARIFAVADVWDALLSDRPYRKAWCREKVAQYLINESGKHFDPYVVNKFLQVLEEGRI